MPSLLRKVKTRLTIHAHRKVRGLLEGEYTSIFHGRSIDFDDLRHYVAGDELKDIDWKATARFGTPMTRRYIASRKHTVLIVADTGRNMAALSAGGQPKVDVAIVAAGVVGHLAAKHGDLVGLVAGDAEHSEVRKPESTDAHLERLLQVMHARTTLAAPPSALLRQLSFVAKGFRRRMVLFVIADDRPLDRDEIDLLRRLAVQHEILWLTVGDVDPTEADHAAASMHDVHDDADIPAYLRSSASLRREFERAEAAAAARAADVFESLAITRRRVEREDDVVPVLFALLHAHRHAHRRTPGGSRAR
ncbi:MAG: hypothetical protein RI885_2575 [Actinomycetota bacterium]|jgi:uncharacterized protein (DUF58 family)